MRHPGLDDDTGSVLRLLIVMLHPGDVLLMCDFRMPLLPMKRVYLSGCEETYHRSGSSPVRSSGKHVPMALCSYVTVAEPPIRDPTFELRGGGLIWARARKRLRFRVEGWTFHHLEVERRVTDRLRRTTRSNSLNELIINLVLPKRAILCARFLLDTMTPHLDPWETLKQEWTHVTAKACGS